MSVRCGSWIALVASLLVCFVALLLAKTEQACALKTRQGKSRRLTFPMSRGSAATAVASSTRDFFVPICTGT